MKLVLSLLFILMTIAIYPQNFNSKDWETLKDDSQKHFTVTKTEKFKIDDYLFDVVWDNKMSYSENIGYYGGIKSLKIYKDNKLINKFENIEDGIALGKIYFNFYDYNFDGYIDFSLPIDAGKTVWRKYFLFDKAQQKFKHITDWDYINIQQFNRKTKQILTMPSGTATKGSQTLYTVKGNHLLEEKIITY